MATASIISPFNHTSDIGYQTWVAELITLLDTGGALVRTADTGQIDGGTTGGTITAVRPAINTMNGYVVYRFNDTLQATAPYFFRFDFGTGSGTSIPRIHLTIGTGSNGAGTLSNIFINNAILSSFGTNSSLVANASTTNFNSYACGHPGTINLAFKRGSFNVDGRGFFYFGIHRVRNSIGEQTGDGIVLVLSNPSGTTAKATTIFAHRRTTNILYGGTINSTSSTDFCLVPLNVTSSIALGGAASCYRHFCSIPDQRPILESVTVINSEVSVLSTFTARPVGNTDRTFLSLGSISTGNASGETSSSLVYGIAMLYD